MPLDFKDQEPDYDVLVQAIHRQEGGDKTRYPYGIKSVKVKDKDEARQVALNTARNNYRRWHQAGNPGDYLSFLANKYTPISDDPTGNAHWKANIGQMYSQILAKKGQTPATADAPAVAPIAPVAPAPVLDPLLLRPLPPVTYPAFPQYPLLKR